MCLLFLRYLGNSLLNVLKNTSIDEEEDDLLLPHLPEEIIIDDILPRLPIKAMMRCKQVCKAWRDLIEGPEFATSRLSKSKASSYLFAELIQDTRRRYGIFEFNKDDDGHHGCTTASQFNGCICMRGVALHSSSANGLVLLWDDDGGDTMFVCNPITREYTQLPPPPSKFHRSSVLGFGASNVSRQYKVVAVHGAGCDVYSAGQWRSFTFTFDDDDDDGHTLSGGGVYLNGNLHWVIWDPNHPLVRCFNLETQVFTTFCVPPHSCPGFVCRQLSDLEGRLCLCDNSNDGELVIWFMNKYGDDKSWAKEFVIKKRYRLERMYPLKLFKDKDGGALLFEAPTSGRLLLYSIKTKTFQEYSLRTCTPTSIIAYAPNFSSLNKILGIQTSHIHSFKL